MHDTERSNGRGSVTERTHSRADNGAAAASGRSYRNSELADLGRVTRASERASLGRATLISERAGLAHVSTARAAARSGHAVHAARAAARSGHDRSARFAHTVGARLAHALVFALVIALCATLALPGGALAPTSSTSAGARGKIQIRYSKEGQSFAVYRLYDLVLYDDGESRETIGASRAIGQSSDESTQNESYDYVIRENLPSGDSTVANPWWTFLTTYGPDGKDSQTPYAVLSTERDKAKLSAAYFVIDATAVTLGDDHDYHVVTVDRKFAMAPEVDTTKYVGANADPNAENEEKATIEAQMVQSFVTSAIEYASGLDISRAQGRYLAVGREATGMQADDADTGTDVYQYSGDNAYLDNVPLGYYLLGTTTGAVCSLSTDKSTALVYDRNEQPELFVQARAKDTHASRLPYQQLSEEEQHDLVWSEDHPRTWTYRMSANVGDLVQYKTIIIATQGVTDYRLHDVMESGLTLVDDAASSERARLYDTDDLRVDGGYDYSPRVYLYSRASDATYDIPSQVGNKTNWVFHKPSDASGAPSDGCDFEVEFRDVSKEAGDADAQKMTFAYVDGADGAGSAAEAASTADADVKTVDVTDWDRIVVTYWARVNDDAVVFDSDMTVEQVETAQDLSTVMDAAGNDGVKLPIQTHTHSDGNNRNTNSAVLTYGNKSHTTWARAEISSYQFDVAKSTASDDNTTYPLLDGATFALYREIGEAATGAVAYTASVNGANKTYYYREDEPLRFTRDGLSYTFLDDASSKGEGEAATSIVTSSHGAVNIRGIEAGTYVLVEQEAPEGFRKLESPLVVTVHDRAYKNIDMVEDNNSGSRHSNAEGDITITGLSASGNMTRDVYTWHATCEGDPATYIQKNAQVDSRKASDDGALVVVDIESVKKAVEQPKLNGGVLVVNTAAETASSGVGVLGIVALLLAAAGATAAILYLRRVKRG